MRRVFLVLVGIVALAVLSVGAFFLLALPPEDSENSESKISKLLPLFSGDQQTLKNIFSPSDLAPPPSNTSLLTGVPRKNFQNPEKIFAIMIEESVAARPNYRGIEAAKILFEMPSEGGIPRFSAIFSTEDIPNEIGPVRSVRDYFLEMIAPIASTIVHAGGSPQAFEFLEKSSLLDIDQDDSDFFRDPDFSPPHDLFFRTNEIEGKIPDSPLLESVFPFSEDIPLGTSATTIEIDFSTESHRVEYLFDPEKNCYQRSQKYEKANLCFENIVAIETEMWLLEDNTDKGRLGIRTLESGKATIFRNGMAISGTWKRLPNALVEFFDENEQKIALSPGKTIVSAIDRSEKLRFSTPEKSEIPDLKIDQSEEPPSSAPADENSGF